MKIVISSGHGSKVAGASGYIVEHEEAVRVVDRTAEYLRAAGVDVTTYEDTVSTSQDENLNRLVDFHNGQGPHDYDISVHFNAYNGQAHGTEVFFGSPQELAGDVSAAIAAAGFFSDRGPKDGSGLYFCAHTAAAAILAEVCFVDNKSDCDLYEEHFDDICRSFAEAVSGKTIPDQPPARPDRPPRPGRPPRPERPPITPPDATVPQTGKVSWFGGPDDQGVSPSEGLAFISNISQAPHLFLPSQPPGTTGLARRLNPHVHFLAMRWDYDEHSKTELLGLKAFVRNPQTGFGVACFPADWGPNSNTGRLVDVSQSVMTDLGLDTDDEVEVIFPYTG